MKASIILRTERVYADGTCPFALRVHMDSRRRVVLGLGGLNAHPDSVNSRGFMKGRDQAARDINMELQRHLSRANEILIKARLAGHDLDPEGFKAEWASDGGSQDFIAWSEKELARQYRVHLICKATRNGLASVLGKLKKYAPQGIHFSRIDRGFLEEFDAWHRKEMDNEYRAIDDGHTARLKAIKCIRKFLYAARRAGVFNGKNPFADFKLPKCRSTMVFLTKQEVADLRAAYDSGKHADELRPFLFSCYTGLRFSDVASLEPTHIVDGHVRKDAVKGNAQKQTRLDVPLTRQALEVLAQGGLPLVRHTDQHINRTLKQAAASLGIKKRVTFHVARHSFATLFLEAGGSVEVLKELMGHSSLSVTMVYVHVGDVRKTSQMAMLERMME